MPTLLLGDTCSLWAGGLSASQPRRSVWIIIGHILCVIRPLNLTVLSVGYYIMVYALDKFTYLLFENVLVEQVATGNQLESKTRTSHDANRITRRQAST